MTLPNDVARCAGNVDAENYTDKQCEQCLRRLAYVADVGKDRVLMIAPMRQWPCPNRIEAEQ
jgi:hypothetical protein